MLFSQLSPRNRHPYAGVHRLANGPGIAVRLAGLLLLLTLGSPQVLAQPQAREETPGIRLSEPSWMDNNHMDQQRQLIDDLARQELGAQLKGSKEDLALLQRIVYRGLIRKEERTKLQALGIVLGDVFVQNLGLEWTIFEDRHGRSRAICIPETEHCLFPVTMLSRRMEVGLLPDVARVYEENAEAISTLLPKNPFAPDQPLP